MKSPEEYFAQQKPVCPVCSLDPEVRQALEASYGKLVRGLPLGIGRLLQWLDTAAPGHGIGKERLRTHLESHRADA